MIRHHLERHRYKVVVGVPIVVLLASSLSFIRSAEEVYIVPDDSRFVAVGETVTLHIMAEADEPVNVIGATVAVPADTLTITNVSREDSIIDLWSEEPTVDDEGRVHFSGGIVRPSGFLGSGMVLTLVVEPHSIGTATLTFDAVQMLAHDGTGMEVVSSTNPITLHIREADTPSPDVNGDNVVNIFDFGIVSSRLFRSYEETYDLNQDGKITLADIGIIISNMGGE